MAQGEFTKEEAQVIEEVMGEIMKAFPKSRVGGFFGHFNDVMLFIAAARRAAPSEKEKK